MKPVPPKPANKQKLLKAIEAMEQKSHEVLTASAAFNERVEAVWNLSDLSEKEALALVQSLNGRRRSAFIVEM